MIAAHLMNENQTYRYILIEHTKLYTQYCENTVNASIVDHPCFVHVLHTYRKYMYEKRVAYYSSVYGIYLLKIDECWNIISTNGVLLLFLKFKSIKKLGMPLFFNCV